MHVLVTGCNRGIGRALCEAALNRGWRVTGTARAFTGLPDVDFIECDLENVARLDEVFAGLAPLDVLINNAGEIGPVRQSPLDMDFAGFRRTLTINTLAPLAVAQACLPALRQRRCSRILSLSSQMSWMDTENRTGLPIALRRRP